jgi:hypothetical protein
MMRTFGYLGRLLAQLHGAPAVAAGFENLRVRMGAGVGATSRYPAVAAALGTLRVCTKAVVCALDGTRRLSARAR